MMLDSRGSSGEGKNDAPLHSYSMMIIVENLEIIFGCSGGCIFGLNECLGGFLQCHAALLGVHVACNS